MTANRSRAVRQDEWHAKSLLASPQWHFYFLRNKWAFFHFSQAREWDGVLRLRGFDYNIYIRAEWPVAMNHGSYLSTSLLFCCQCSSISVFTACCVLKFCQTISLSGTFLQISQRHLREIIWTHDIKDTEFKTMQKNSIKNVMTPIQVVNFLRGDMRSFQHSWSYFIASVFSNYPEEHSRLIYLLLFYRGTWYD